jgi:hypothetical protein
MAYDVITAGGSAGGGGGGGVDPSRTISGTAPIRIDGGASGDLSANRTISINAATTSAAGSMSSADKSKLDGLPTAAYSTVADAGSAVTQRGTVNFIDGNSATVAVVDNAGAARTDVTVAVTTTPSGQTAVGATRTLTGTAPILIDGGASGDLSANRTISISAATTSAAGSMSSDDKSKLDNALDSAQRATIATTSAAATSIGSTISIAAGEMVNLDVYVMGRLTTHDGSIVRYYRSYDIENTGGTITARSTAQPFADFEATTPTNLTAAGAPTLVLSNGTPGTIQVQVNGIAATNLTWSAFLRVRRGF